MEQSILSALTERFPELAGSTPKRSTRRIFLEIPMTLCLEILAFAKTLGFGHLITITGLDLGEDFGFIYHLGNDQGLILNLQYTLPRQDPVVIPSILGIYAGATFYERELEGMFGVQVSGLPKGRQYPLPDNWPQGQYPLRKDWIRPDNLAQLAHEQAQNQAPIFDVPQE